MIYMFKVYALVAVGIFGLAGALILALLAWTQAKQYALALQAMRRIARSGVRDSFVISRTRSRNHRAGFFDAA